MTSVRCISDGDAAVAVLVMRPPLHLSLTAAVVDVAMRDAVEVARGASRLTDRLTADRSDSGRAN